MGKIKEFLGKFNIKEQLNNQIDQSIKSTLKESSSTTNLLREIQQQKFGSWKSEFISDIYQERIMYPHEEMKAAKKAYLYNSFVAAAVNSLRDFVIGGELKISSEDNKFEKEANRLFKITGLRRILQLHLAEDIPTIGNFYAERMYSGKQIEAYDYIPVPERMYHDLDARGNIKRYIQELPEEQLVGSYATMKYYADRRKTIKGIELDKNKIMHVKMGVAKIPSYGRGAVCSIINDFEVIVEIERAMAVMARYKAIPKKALMPAQDQEVEPNFSEHVGNQMAGIGDDENPILNFRVDDLDLSYAGKELNVEPLVSYLKKKLTVALAPSFMIHGEETRYANSKEQRISFQLRIEAIRSALELDIKREVTKLVKSYGITPKKFEIEFGTYDLGDDEETRKAAIELFNSGVINLNEAREMMGLDEAAEVGEFFSFDLKKNQPGSPEDVQAKIPDEQIEQIKNG